MKDKPFIIEKLHDLPAYVLHTSHQSVLEDKFGYNHIFPKIEIFCIGRPHLLMHQQGASSVMFWAGIVDSELVGSFKVKDSVKMTAGVYVDFLKLNFIPWHKYQSLTFRKKFVYMHDNAPSHAARLTTEYI